MKASIYLVNTVILFTLTTGCGKSSDNSGVESASEIAAAAAGGASNAGGSAMNEVPRKSMVASALGFLNPISSATASGQCPIFSTGLCAGGNTVTLTYSGCSFNGGNGSTWNGGQVLAFGNNSCSNGVPVYGAGNSLSRTFTGSLNNNPTTRTNPAGVAVSLDSSTLSGYLSPQVSGGFQITGVSGGHTVDILGLNLVSNRWNHTVTTNASLGGSSLNVNFPNYPGFGRTIQSGAIVVEHNLAKYVGIASFSNVAWNGTSCFPQSGSITTNFSGSKSGNEVLTFTGGGSATLVENGGAPKNITLSHCF